MTSMTSDIDSTALTSTARTNTALTSTALTSTALTSTALTPFVAAGVIGHAARHFAARCASREPLTVQLGAALAVEAVQRGDSCVDVTSAAERFAPEPVSRVEGLEGSADDTADPDEAEPVVLAWPEPDAWLDALRASRLVGALASSSASTSTMLVLDGSKVFLRRFAIDEMVIADWLVAHATATLPDLDADDDALLSALLPVKADGSHTAPRKAVRLGLTRNLTVLTGGPGTGKTYTLARMLAAMLRRDPGLDIALAAPTGKAAARMTDAVRQAVTTGASNPDSLVWPRAMGSLVATTMHKLLGSRPGDAPRHNARNLLSADVVVIDEASMVSLPLMADLLRAIPPSTRLVLIGDPFQLASVEAGSVLGDLVHTESLLAPNICQLTTNHRSISALNALFDAVNDGDADEVMEILDAATVPPQATAGPTIRWIDTSVPPGQSARSVIREATRDLIDNVLVGHAQRLVGAAEANDLEAAYQLLVDTKVLCATRRGDLGVADWTESIEARIRPAAGRNRRWYGGQPVLVTSNDYVNDLYNGDSGINVDGRVWFPDATGGRSFDCDQLLEATTWWAMTIHKSQGSEFDHVVVAIPDNCRIATRELLYTGLTRARQQITLVASEAAIRTAVATPARRVSGLADRLSVES